MLSLRSAAIAGLLFIACAHAFGQANQGSITGTVRDQSGAVIANAPIEIRNAGTGAIFRSRASETGNFSVPVPTGTYELSVMLEGFKSFVQTNIPVVEGTATRRDVQLELGAVSDVITVTDTAPLLKTEGGDISYRVTSATANQIPVLTLSGTGGAIGNIRNPLAMTDVLPGVTRNPNGFPTLVVNGLPANSQTWTIEGQDATPTLWRGVNFDRGQGGVDAIEAMSVQTSNFAAEFGKAGGAAINFTMKSGTNDYHGSLYDYFVNEFLNAGTPNFDYADLANNGRFEYRFGQHVRNRQRRNDYGGTFGGPVVLPKVYDGHNKTFFFFNFEQFRETQQNASGTVTVPTLAYRQGNFASAGCSNFDVNANVCLARQPIINTVTGQPAVDPAGEPLVNGGIYDPASYRIQNGFPVRTLFPNQQIPMGAFDPVALNIQNLFPLPTNPNLTNNYSVPPYETFRHTSIPSIKIDHNLGSTMRISGYWGQTITNQNTTGNQGFSDYPFSSTQFNPYRNNTVRINFDHTIAPTMILHIGIGYFHQKEPNQAFPFDQRLIGLPGPGQPNAFPAPNIFPTIGGLNNFTAGGFSPGIGATFDAIAWEQKPTANLNLTWVKGNHTYKFGGDMTIEGYPTHNAWRANGNLGFSAAQSGNPYEFGQPLNITNPTGFQYASFLMGDPNTLELAQRTYTKLGGHAFAFFAQDNWKITPKLTVEYGLRYDYQTYLREQYGRHGSASFSLINPPIGLPGALAYEGGGPCACRLSSNYPYAFGPRLNVSYQIFEKTVLRAGFGINYNVVQTPAGNNFSVGDFYQINPPAYGVTPLEQGLQGGNVFYRGNPYGNTEVVWPVFDPGRIPPLNGGLRPPSSPFSMYHPDARPGRISQWSVGMQREVLPNLVVEANYVGNRGVWFYSPLLDVQAQNTLGGGQLEHYGLDITRAEDRTLLTQVIGSQAAASRGFFAPYGTFPLNQQVAQAIRPFPQWNLVNSYLGPNRGNTWYDSLQVQATKRYSNGLDFNVNFTYAHASVLGASSDTDFFLQGRPALKDPYNRQINKQINQLVPPLKTVISGTYTTPGLGYQDGPMKFLSTLVKDWQFGAVLQYQSGPLLQVPNSNNALTTLLRMAGPGNFGTVYNLNPWNYVPGSSFWREPGFDPNSDDFDPRAYNAASPAASGVLAGGYGTFGNCAVENCAWVEPAPGQWGVTAPYLEGYRWRRRPTENINFGRNFRMREGRVVLNVRAEFINAFNRLYYGNPSIGNPTQIVTTQTQRAGVVPTGGYGVVNTLNGAGSAPRTGTIVARLTF